MIAALAGVAWAIREAVKVLVAGSVSLGGLAELTAGAWLKNRLEQDRALMAGHDTLAELADDYASALEDRKTTYETYLAAQTDTVKLGVAKTADANARFLAQTVDSVLEVASFEAVSGAFRDARRNLFGGAIVAALRIVVFAAAANPADKDHTFSTPAISATLGAGAASVRASFSADSLRSGDRLQVSMTAEPHGGTLYDASFGPDPSGEVNRTVELRLTVGRRTRRILIRTWRSDDGPGDCFAPDSSSETGCAQLRLPTPDSRPQLNANWAGKTLELTVRATSLARDRAIGLRVVAVSRTERLRLYGADLAPYVGKLDATVKVEVSSRFAFICAEAMVVPSRETNFVRARVTPMRRAMCPLRRSFQLSWVRTAVPG